MAGSAMARVLGQIFILISFTIWQFGCIPPDRDANFIGPHGKNNKYRAIVGDEVKLTIWNYSTDLMFSSYVIQVIIEVEPKSPDIIAAIDARRIKILFNDQLMNLYDVNEEGLSDGAVASADVTFGLSCDQDCLDALRGPIHDSVAEVKFILDSAITLNGSILALDTIVALDRINLQK
jgi:hypothetical protein